MTSTGIEYEIAGGITTCRGCLADSRSHGDLCGELGYKHKCGANNLIFVRKTDRLTLADFDDLKTKAIQLYAGTWLHHWGQMVEEEVLRRHGLLKG